MLETIQSLEVTVYLKVCMIVLNQAFCGDEPSQFAPMMHDRAFHLLARWTVLTDLTVFPVTHGGMYAILRVKSGKG